jgi:Leucine-rich repeat (LRR) protein
LIWKPLTDSTFQSNWEGSRQASGEVTVPPQTQLWFQPGQQFADDPQLFKDFAPDELTILSLKTSLSGDYEWGDKQLACIATLTGLEGLDINGASITDRCIESLNKLKKLTGLKVGHTALSGKALAKLDRLPKLVTLDVGHLASFSDALPELKHCLTLTQLDANDCRLTDRDVNIIATMPNLKVLNVRGNLDITDQGILSICHQKKIKDLDLSRTGVSPSCINLLQKLPLLVKLTIETNKWTAKERAHIKIALPNCTISNIDPSDQNYAAQEVLP